MNELEILQKLKSNLLSVNSDIKDTKDFFGNTEKRFENSEKAQNYYLLDSSDNLYGGKPDFKLGTGIEAIRSSAAMIYNILGDDTLIIDGISYKGTDPKFERGFPAIKADKKSKHEAQLDASLISDDGKSLLLVESKCMEWIDSKPNKALKAAYLNKENYPSIETAEIFIPEFRKLINDNVTSDEYKPLYGRYDAIQMLIHILGIYNWCKDTKKLPFQIKLVNLVWDCNQNEKYLIEEKEGIEFIDFANVTFRKYFKKLNIDFSTEYVRYSDFIKRINWNNSLKRRAYLSRYEIKGLTNKSFQDNYDTLYKETWHQGEPRTINNSEGLFFNNLTESKLKNEDWRSLSFIPGYTRYSVSNLGRVKVLISGKETLIPQSDKNHPGYLRLDPDGLYNVDHDINVYTLIAIGFLGKQFNDGYDVHHRNNNGLDCRVENLILLTRKQHQAVHSSKPITNIEEFLK